MKRICLALSLLLAVMLLPVSSMAFEVGARVYYWFPTLDGDVAVDDEGVEGTTLDFDDVLDIDDESYPCVEAFVGLGDHHLSLTYTEIGPPTVQVVKICSDITYSFSLILFREYLSVS